VLTACVLSVTESEPTAGRRRQGYFAAVVQGRGRGCSEEATDGHGLAAAEGQSREKNRAVGVWWETGAEKKKKKTNGRWTQLQTERALYLIKQTSEKAV